MNEELRNPLDDLGSDNPTEETAAPEGQPAAEGVSAPAEQAPPAETKEAELILGKFKTVEDLGKGYQELERAYTGDRQAVAALQKLASQWHVDGRPLSAENLLEFAHKAMLEQYTKGKPAEKAPEEDIYVDPDVKKFLEPHLSEIQALKTELADLKKVNTDRVERDKSKTLADAETWVQEEGKRIMNHAELKVLELTEEQAYRCMNLAGPNETGEDVARKILKMVQKGTDNYIKSKKAGQSQVRETGGSSPVIEEKELRFRPEGEQVSPLKAWESSPI